MLLAFLLATANPSASSTVAAATPAPVTYRTTIVRRFASFGTNGTLKLWFLANGYVRGTYVSDDGGSAAMTVTGGRDGAKIWLDFPGLGHLHIGGTLENGVIHGVGAKSSGAAQFVFTATPVTSSS